MSSYWSSLRTAISDLGVPVMVAFRRILRAMHLLAQTAWNFLEWLAHSLSSLCTAAYSRATAVVFGPLKEFVVGPLQVALLGKRHDVSLLITLVSPVLALVTAWWVKSTVGYEILARWVRGTWFGTDPSLAIFLAAGSLLGLGVISAGINSGLLPTGVLVSAPMFGASLTRYGTTLTLISDSQIVSLPNAVGVAIVFAVGLAIPLTISGFVIGRTLSRVIYVYNSRGGLSSTVDNI